jgi:hypothetical protein
MDYQAHNGFRDQRTMVSMTVSLNTPGFAAT